jgi:hypothetical protein
MEDDERYDRLRERIVELQQTHGGQAVILYAAFCRIIQSTPSAFQENIAPVITHLVMRLLADDMESSREFFHAVNELLYLAQGTTMMLVPTNKGAPASPRPPAPSAASELQAEKITADILSRLRKEK